MSEVELDRLLKQQGQLEREVAKLISNTVKNSQNSVLRLFLDRLVLDSLKHADMIEALIDLRKGAVVSIVQREEMQKALEDHVVREKEMLARLDEILARVNEPKVKRLLEHIAEDERNHHKILDEVNNILSWRDATQEQWWNTIDRIEWLF